jgi:hypothetical protein
MQDTKYERVNWIEITKEDVITENHQTLIKQEFKEGSTFLERF